jgi:hypothetical protein
VNTSEGGVAIPAMCGDMALVLIPSPPPLAAVWEVPARRFRRRVGAPSSCACGRGGVNRPTVPTTLVVLRCWLQSAAPRHRVSAAKRTPSGETAWGPEVLQFRLWAEQRGYRGDGEPHGPPKLGDSTAHAPAKTITPLYTTDYLFVSFSLRAERCNSPRCLK